MKEKSKLQSGFVIAGFAIIFFFAFMIFMRILTIKILKMDNALISCIYGRIDGSELGESVESIDYDWQALYPFAKDSEIEENATNKTQHTGREYSIIQKATAFTEKVERVKLPLNSYATDLLFGYKQIVEVAKKYDDLLGWNFASYSEYNGAVQLPDGHMTEYIEKRDASGNARSMIDFANFCK